MVEREMSIRIVDQTKRIEMISTRICTVYNVYTHIPLDV